VRVFRALLRLFPGEIRRERGEEMERLVADMRAEWEEEGGRSGTRFWVTLVWDTAREAAREWLSQWSDSIRSIATMTVGEHMSALWGDVRFAVRQLVREPLYGVTIVVLMALGVAGNAAVFRVFNGLFLKPLPFDSPEQLVDLDETAPSWDLEFLSVAYRDYAAWRDNNETFQSMAVYDYGGGNFVADGSAQRVSYLLATHDIDDVLRLDPLRGRFFGPEEDHPDGARVMLISQGFWDQEFGGDPDVIGRTFNLNGYQVEVIGVLPPQARFMSGIGRLAEDATIEQARADLMAIHKGLIPEHDENEISSPVVHSLRERYLGEYRLGSGFLLGAVGIVLLIACANIAGLMTARSFARASEMAVRAAMGAPRLRIVRQLLTESLVLAGVGALAGAALGVWGSGQLVEPMADQFPNWVTFDLDVRFLLFTLTVTVAAAVLFGLAPALQASRRGDPALSPGTRSTTSAGRRRAMSLLVAGEVALALTLLVVGGLSVLDVKRLGDIDPGFEAEGLISYRVSLPSQRYPDDASRLAFAEDYVEALEAIPGVESAAVTSAMPLSGHWGWFFVVDGAPPRADDEANPVVLHRAVSPSYFETAGVQLLAGRLFDDFDGRDDTSPVIIVNETFVRSHLSHLDDPVGARVIPGIAQPTEEVTWMTVVGVTRDVKHYGVDEKMRPGVYQPLAQYPLAGFQVAIRERGETATIMSAVRTVTADLDVELPVYRVEAMNETLDDSLWTRRAMSWLIAAFSSVALLMAIAGIYGVISYSVGQRSREISIRMAMGAKRQQVVREVVTQGISLVALGAGVGLALSVAGAGLVSGILVGVSSTNPAVYAGMTALVLAVAALANYIPARRAARLDPVKALRGE
jgi:predicted permease